MHTASSTWNNSITAGPYDVKLTETDFEPHLHGGSANAAIPAFVTPYSLTNTISFNLPALTDHQPQDNFVVASKVTGAVVPEPASLVTMTLGMMPLSLFWVVWVRRIRRPVPST